MGEMVDTPTTTTTETGAVTATPVVESEPNFDEMSLSEQLQYLSKHYMDDEDDGIDNGDGIDEADEPKAEEAQGDQPQEADQGPEVKADEGKETGEETDQAEPPSEEKPADQTADVYSPDQFNALDPFAVDPSRLPSAARLVHQRYMEIYRRDILPALQELEALRSQAQPQAPQSGEGSDASDHRRFVGAVKAEVARRLGAENFDDFNAEHLIIASQVASEMLDANRQVQAQAQRQQDEQARLTATYQGVVESLRAEDSDFDAIDRWALSEIENLPYKTAQKFYADLSGGDPEKVKAVYRAFRDRYRERQTVKAPKAPTKGEQPPKVSAGSVTGSGTQPRWSTEDFAGSSLSRQAQMLASAGYVDDI